jgi:hypothetical protein
MSNFSVMVKYKGDIDKVVSKISELLEPYDENKRVDGYIEFHKSKEKEYLQDEINKNQGIIDKAKISPTEAKNYNIEKCEERLKELLKMTPNEYFNGISDGYDFDKHGNAISHYNPDSKWDWYTIGGRWSGILKLKKETKGKTGQPGVFNNPTGIDIAYAKDLDLNKMKKFSTYAVLDEEGWKEYSSMGWFGISYNKTEDDKTWNEKFKERFLTNCDEDTVIVIVDCHI